jgi:type IV pilus assembly protein PilQ
MSPYTRTVNALAVTTAILLIILLSHYSWADKQKIKVTAVIKSGYIHQKHLEKPKALSDKMLIISGEKTILDRKVIYKGERLTLKFKEADIRDVIVFLCDVGGLNVVFDPGVSGKISCDLRDVPWDQALDVILKTNRLGKTFEGDVLRIGKTDDLIDK